MSSAFFPQTIDLSSSLVQLIRTALGNPRVTLDKTGLKAYDGSGNIILNVDATTGNATFTGEVIADRGVEIDFAQIGSALSSILDQKTNAVTYIDSNGNVVGQEITERSDMILPAPPTNLKHRVVRANIAGAEARHIFEVYDANDNLLIARTLLDGVGRGDFLQLPQTKNAKLWWGAWTGAGAINVGGSGDWSIVRNSVGNYTVTVTGGPANAILVPVAMDNQGSPNITYSAGTGSTNANGTGTVNFTTYSVGAAADIYMSFAIFGA